MKHRRKKIVQDTPDQQDRWLVSYADFITLLFAFFVVMYASSSVNASKYRQLSESIGTAFNSKLDLKKADIQNNQTIPSARPEAEVKAVSPSANQDDHGSIALQKIKDDLAETQLALKIALDQQENEKLHQQQVLGEQYAEKANLSNTLDKVQQELDQTIAMNRKLMGANNDRTQLLDNIQRSLFAQGIQVEIDTRNGILRLPETILFDSGRAEFRSGGAKALKIVAENLMQILPCYAESGEFSTNQASCANASSGKLHRMESLLIEGHTDSLPISNSAFKDNWDLSVARAKNTYLELIKAEPTLEKLENEMKQPLVSFSAYAGRRPIAENDTEINRRKNRRIDIRFIMAAPTIGSNLKELDTSLSN